MLDINLYFDRDSKGKSPKKFLMCFGFVMPCIVIIVCYSAIFAKVRQSRRNVQTHTTRYRFRCLQAIFSFFIFPHNTNLKSYQLISFFISVKTRQNMEMKTFPFQIILEISLQLLQRKSLKKVITKIRTNKIV